MQYLILIYDNETASGSLSEAEMRELMGTWWAYDAEMKKAGVFRAGDALKPTSTATTVRIRNGKTLVTDGPFAETKEQLGGYYLIDVPNIEDALKWAAKCPAAATGSVEVRPIMVFEQ